MLLSDAISLRVLADMRPWRMRSKFEVASAPLFFEAVARAEAPRVSVAEAFLFRIG